MGAPVSSAALWRSAAAISGLALAAFAVALYLATLGIDGLSPLDWVRTLLVGVMTLFVSWGAAIGLIGLFYREPAIPAGPRPSVAGLTAILVPVCNEDPVATLSRVAAMERSLAATGQGDRFHFAILSDTRDPALAEAERRWVLRLVDEHRAEGRIFYRRRLHNHGRKAGNIEDFITSSGAVYDFALILDADSLMEGATIVEMVRRMEAAPQLGLLQSLPQVIHAETVFGRALQFAANLYSPIFSRGLATIQGSEGPFWGHNALVRTIAFAESCGLPEIEGRPPFGGHILSHDYVEAALLARRGWQVRLDPDLIGSYEEAPQTIIQYAKRDRRWCQGNLQHARLLATPRLKLWSRLSFVQGIMAYLASPIWAVFILLGIVAALDPAADGPVPPLALAVAILSLLVAPKLLVAAKAIVTGQAAPFGGPVRLLASVLAEIALSTLVAPLMLMFQIRAIAEIVAGADGGWPASDRESQGVSWAEAWQASFWMVIAAAALLAALLWSAPASVPWLLPVLLPLLGAPWLIRWSSRPAVAQNVYISGPDEAPSPAMLERRRILHRWSAPAPVSLLPIEGAVPAN